MCQPTKPALASEEITIDGDGVITATVQVSDSLTVRAAWGASSTSVLPR